MPVSKEPLAHLDPDGREHLLVDHLGEVSRLAEGFGAAFGAGGSASLAGRWHDLGKYSAEFQNRIRTENGFEAHLEGGTAGQRDHSTAGARLAFERFRANGLPIAFAIAGHHAGLGDWEQLKADRLTHPSKKPLLDECLGRAPAELLAAGAPVLPFTDPARLELWTRMLFSALCDADFLDTERFYSPDRSDQRGGRASIEELASTLGRALRALEAIAPATEVNRVRAEVRRACGEAAPRPPGVFSLTVPTGGGKTLAAMAFALEHARVHALGRVVVAVPFTSVIEQTAKVYRDAFASLGTDVVVEHHSALDPQVETPRNRLAAENWDAPIIVTTTVQLFESLFANRPGACRKLHRLARSVVVLDEAQSLPRHLLTPILRMLRQLGGDFGSSIVFSTATQPAFRQTARLPEGFEAVHEIVPAETRAFERLRRVRVRWPASTTDAMPWDRVAAEVAAEPDVLVVVHRRRDARELCERLDALLGHGRTLHLSALMCPAHRSELLSSLRERRGRGEPVRLVATQLVEAGVDLDFPVVYRALAGLDSLAQAAGRCNREGRLDGLGELRVFVAESAPPRGVPRQGLEIARGLLATDPELDLFGPAVHHRYFEQLYDVANRDGRGIEPLRARLQYRRVADSFRLIEDDWSAPLVVPFGGAPDLVARLAREGPSRELVRALQRFIVNVPRRDRDAWLASGTVRLVADTAVVLEGPFGVAYDPRFGLVPDRVGRADPTSLIVSAEHE